jgi:Tol biopolymer transport system component/tRNA A-37 threonylcarbamoyl transferase component Bud32
VTSVNPPLADAIRDRYELERELGSGGMATVYLARDLKHHRRVAVKVLRPELAATLGGSRFLSEIKVAAALQHPHILPLLDSGETNGFLYYVMPHVEGPSLRERLDKDGELPIPEAVRILAEVADALDYAHQQGVVHRDIKPDNIMLSGRHSLVMDFGIAKAVSDIGGSARATTEGVALGTPTYMAPEQAVADPHLDQRVDIYSFGVMGYELLTGSPPFSGVSAQQVLAAHVTQPPDLISHRRTSVPPALAALIMRCLEKRPADRPQSASELVHAFERMITQTEGLAPAATRRLPKLRWTFSPRLGIALAALAIAVVGVFLWQSRSAQATHSTPRYRQLTFLGNVQRQELSPDGQFLAYVERGDDTLRLMVKDLSGGTVVPITAIGKLDEVRWSPDGASLLHIGYKGDALIGELFPRLGGPSRRLPRSSTGQSAAFSPDGSRLATWMGDVGGAITVTMLATGARRVLRVPARVGFLAEGDWSPDGRFLAVQSHAEGGMRSSLWIGNLTSAAWRELVTDTLPLSPPRWSRAGDAIYFYTYQNELRKLRVRGGEPEGSPEILQTGLGATYPGHKWAGFSITSDGRKLSYVKEQEYSNLWLLTKSRDRRELTRTKLTQGTGEKVGKHVSPDGRFVAFVQAEGGYGNIVVAPIEGGEARKLTASSDATGHPAWSPDGRHVAFIVSTRGGFKVRTVSVDGGEARTYEHSNVGQAARFSWAPNDRILYESSGNRNFRWLDPSTEAEQSLVANDSAGWMFDPFPSPDGKYVAVYWNRSPRAGVYTISLRDHAQIFLSPAEDWPLGWSTDGSFVYVWNPSDGRVRKVPAQGGREVMIGQNPFKNADCGLVSGSAAEVSLLCTVEEAVGDAWVLENFDSAVH